MTAQLSSWSGRGRRILVIDEEPSRRGEVARCLADDGHVVDEAASPRAVHEPVDLVIVDPHRFGLRFDQGARVLALSPAADLEGKIRALEAGADDYLVAPYHPRELLARVRAITRFAAQPSQGEARLLVFGGVTLDLQTRGLTGADGRRVSLTARQFDLLQVLAENPWRPLSRDELLEQAFDDDGDVFDRAIDVQVSRLRKRLAMAGAAHSLIRTQRSEGYMLQSSVRRVRAYA